MGDYFIRLDDGKELRRKTLESSKASINILREHNKLLRIRKAKLQLIQSLRRELKDLTTLMNRLQKTIPQLTKKELKELNPELPSLEESSKKSKKSKKSSGTDDEEESGEDAVFIGRPEPKRPRRIVEETEEAPKPEPKSKEERLREKLSDIEKKLQGL